MGVRGDKTAGKIWIRLVRVDYNTYMYKFKWGGSTGGANLQYGGSVFHCCHTLGVINSGLIEGTSARIHSTLKRFPTTCDQANNAIVYCNIYIQ